MQIFGRFIMGKKPWKLKVMTWVINSLENDNLEKFLIVITRKYR
jgi:hypothetical protein